MNNDAQYPRLWARFLSVFTEGGRPSDSAADHFIWFPDARNHVFHPTGITFSSSPDSGCNQNRYIQRIAQRLYEEQRTSSREGVNLSRKDLIFIDRIVRPLVDQGQSPYMILANHPELDMSVKTLYNYINKGILLTRNIDLKRKTKFKPRKRHKKQIFNRAVFEGRTYNDFQALDLDPDDFVEMDTVLSARGSLKCILTIYFPPTELLVARLLQRCTPGLNVKHFFTLYGK